VKAADIPDSIVLQAVDAKAPHWASISDVAALVPDFPWKVVHAKCAQMIRKGRISGCPCGCRGDLERRAGIRDKSRAVINFLCG